MWAINGIVQTLTNEQKAQVLIDTCTQLGFDIPRFCYHENLKIAGNCRMCLIEDSKAPKPVICCAGNAVADLNIFTNTVQVKKARESVMEFLLINHPLDCPICDQGGECDLQDLSLVYGSDHGRFYDYKRNVEDKNCGPVVKTVMNRCILCTRCVRFATDIAGFEALGVTGRGGKMEIGSYVEKILDSELSGNLVDVRPVGALTSKPYSFVSRPWEIKKINLFSLIDDQPQFIRADIKENEIVRFMPAKNARGVNVWITNRTRFSYEGLNRNRAVDPLVFGQQSTWVLILNTFKNLLYKTLSNLNLKQKELLSITFNDISNFDYFDLMSVKTAIASTGLSATEKKILTFTFLPRVSSDVLHCVDNAILINLNLNFELPITALLLQQSLTNNATSKPASFLLKWRSCVTPLLKPFALSLGFSISTLLNFLAGKTWFNSIYQLGDTLSTSLCLYTFEWDYILRMLKINFFKFLNLFLFVPMASYRLLFDINLFREDLFFEQTSINNFFLINWQLGGLREDSLTSNSSTSLMQAVYQNSNIFRVPFIVPTKSYLENNSIFYNLDYTYFKSFRVISSPNYSKTVKSFVKVLGNLLNLYPDKSNLIIQPLQNGGKIFWSLKKIITSNSFLTPNLVSRKSPLSKVKFYQMFSILTHSPTISALQRTTFNLNIY